MINSDELIANLSNYIPNELAKDIITYFGQIRQDLSTRTLERASPGKFIETVVQILQFLENGKYDKSPRVDDYFKNLENRPANLSDDLRIALARVARASYSLRNKRNIAHKGEIDPNIYDLRYIYYAGQWILSEIVRHILSSDIDTASQIIELIQIQVNPVVEDFGDKRLVLKVGTTEEELLVLLLHYFPEYTSTEQIYSDMNRRPKSTVSNVIASAYRKRHIEGNRKNGYKLTILGHNEATRIVQNIILN